MRQNKAHLLVLVGLPLAALLMCAGVLDSPGTAAASSGASRAFVGDYLFDRKDIGAVFLTHVYEEDGEIYAMLDIADRPMQLEPKDAGKYEYRRKSDSGRDFAFKFIKGDGGDFEQLNMKSESYRLDLTGTRFTEDIVRLRDYHAGRPETYAYRKPLEVEGCWEVSTLEEAGIDAAGLHLMMNDIYENYDYVHSILIVKGGKLVFEEYVNGWDPVRLHRLQSVSKSFTSTLTGLAIEAGFIGSLKDPLYEYLPEYSSLFDDAKKGILIEHLLTMSAGFEWNEMETYYADPEACDAHIAGASGDFIKYVLEKPMAGEPGAAYYYNSGLPNMLGYIITQESGMSFEEFSCEFLFEPLGIRRSYWQPTTGETRPSCAGGLRLMSRDMARYGQLYLRGGSWNGRQILSSEFVETSTTALMDTGADGGYGYLWRTYDQEGFSAFLASGTGGQYIVCIPATDVVVVTTAVYSTDKSDNVAGLLLKYVVPAVMQ